MLVVAGEYDIEGRFGVRDEIIASWQPFREFRDVESSWKEIQAVEFLGLDFFGRKRLFNARWAYRPIVAKTTCE